MLPISQQSAYVLSSLGDHNYEGFALNDDEKPRLVRDLGDSKFLMLRNHGLLTVGETVADAFVYMYLFQRVCSIQVRAQSCGTDLVPSKAPNSKRRKQPSALVRALSIGRDYCAS